MEALISLSLLAVEETAGPGFGDQLSATIQWAVDNQALVVALLGFLTFVLYLIIALVRTTRWGKANKEALDTLVEVVGTAKRSGFYADRIPDLMKTREPASPRGVVNAWKKARDRRDPKPKK